MDNGNDLNESHSGCVTCVPFYNDVRLANSLKM